MVSRVEASKIKIYKAKHLPSDKERADKSICEGTQYSKSA